MTGIRPDNPFNDIGPGWSVLRPEFRVQEDEEEQQLQLPERPDNPFNDMAYPVAPAITVPPPVEVSPVEPPPMRAMSPRYGEMEVPVSEPVELPVKETILEAPGTVERPPLADRVQVPERPSLAPLVRTSSSVVREALQPPPMRAMSPRYDEVDLPAPVPQEEYATLRSRELFQPSMQSQAELGKEQIMDATASWVRQIAQWVADNEQMAGRQGEAGPVMGPSGVRQQAERVAEQARGVSAVSQATLQNLPRPKRLNELDTSSPAAWLKDFSEWASLAAVQGAVSTIPPIVGGMVGGAVGGAPGAIAGALGPGYILNQNEVRNSLMEEGLDEKTADYISSYAGVPMALLDAVVPAKLVGSLSKPVRQALNKTVARQVLSTLVENGALEGVTEMAQGAISQGTTAAVTGRPIDWMQFPEEGLTGAITGGLMAAPVAAANVVRQGEATPRFADESVSPAERVASAEAALVAHEFGDIRLTDEQLRQAREALAVNVSVPPESEVRPPVERPVAEEPVARPEAAPAPERPISPERPPQTMEPEPPVVERPAVPEPEQMALQAVRTRAEAEDMANTIMSHPSVLSTEIRELPSGQFQVVFTQRPTAQVEPEVDQVEPTQPEVSPTPEATIPPRNPNVPREEWGTETDTRFGVEGTRVFEEAHDIHLMEQNLENAREVGRGDVGDLRDQLNRRWQKIQKDLFDGKISQAEVDEINAILEDRRAFAAKYESETTPEVSDIPEAPEAPEVTPEPAVTAPLWKQELRAIRDRAERADDLGGLVVRPVEGLAKDGVSIPDAAPEELTQELADRITNGKGLPALLGDDGTIYTRREPAEHGDLATAAEDHFGVSFDNPRSDGWIIDGTYVSVVELQDLLAPGETAAPKVPATEPEPAVAVPEPEVEAPAVTSTEELRENLRSLQEQIASDEALLERSYDHYGKPLKESVKRSIRERMGVAYREISAINEQLAERGESPAAPQDALRPEDLEPGSAMMAQIKDLAGGVTPEVAASMTPAQAEDLISQWDEGTLELTDEEVEVLTERAAQETEPQTAEEMGFKIGGWYETGPAEPEVAPEPAVEPEPVAEEPAAELPERADNPFADLSRPPTLDEMRAYEEKQRALEAEAEEFPAILRDEQVGEPAEAYDREPGDQDATIDEYLQRIEAALEQSRVGDARALYEEANQFIHRDSLQDPMGRNYMNRIEAAEAEAKTQTALFEEPEAPATAPKGKGLEAGPELLALREKVKEYVNNEYGEGTWQEWSPERRNVETERWQERGGPPEVPAKAAPQPKPKPKARKESSIAGTALESSILGETDIERLEMQREYWDELDSAGVPTAEESQKIRDTLAAIDTRLAELRQRPSAVVEEVPQAAEPTPESLAQRAREISPTHPPRLARTLESVAKQIEEGDIEGAILQAGNSLTNMGPGETRRAVEGLVNDLKVLPKAPEPTPAAEPPKVAAVQKTVEEGETPASPEDLRKLVDAAATAMRENNLPTGPRELRKWAGEVLGRPYESGTWRTDDMYDAIEGAAHMALWELIGSVNNQSSATVVQYLKAVRDMEEKMFARRTRSEGMVARQQFSTPLDLSAAAAYALGNVDGATVLEPSAGTGNLVSALANSEAKLYLNEIDPRRAEILRHVFGDDVEVWTGDALMIPIDHPQAFHFIISNPPWGGRNTGKIRGFGATEFKASDISQRHFAQYVKAMNPNARHVSIMPPGYFNESAAPFRKWLAEQGTIVAEIESPAGSYATRGTDFGSVMVVFDKAQRNIDKIRLREPTWEEWYEEIPKLGGGMSHGPLDRLPLEERKPIRGPETPETPRKTAELIDRGGESPEISGEAPAPDPVTQAADALIKAAQSLKEATSGQGQTAGGVAGRPTEVPAATERTGVGTEPERPVPESGVRPEAGGGRGAELVAGEGRTGEAAEPGEAEVAVPRLARGRVEPDPSDSPARRREIEAANDSPVFAPATLGITERRAQHPRLVVETRSMAGMAAPAPTAQIQSEVVDGAWGRDGAKGGLSDDQAYGVLHVLSGWERGHGVLLADDVGVGKTREAAALILEEFARGKTVGIYSTKGPQQVEAAIREFKLVATESETGQFPAHIVDLRDYPNVLKGEEDLPIPDGPTLYIINFYNTARAAPALSAVKPEFWVADEAHTWKNQESGAGMAWAGLHDIALGNNADIAYLTATPGVTLDELGYLYGLKEWKRGGFADWVERKLGRRGAVEEGDEVAAAMQAADQEEQLLGDRSGTTDVDANLAEIDEAVTKGKPRFMKRKGDVFKQRVTPAETEQIMRELKGAGKYLARDLWRGGVEFEVQEIDMVGDSPEATASRERYDKAAALARDIFETARKYGYLNESKAGAGDAGIVRSLVQSYLKQLLFEIRLPKVLAQAEKELEAGRQVVVTVHSVSGDIENLPGVSAEDQEMPLNRRLEAAVNRINTQQIEKEGQGDETEYIDLGEIPEAIADRARLLDQIRELEPLSDPQKVLEDRFGADNVAVVTGKTPAKQRPKVVAEFQAGKRNVALISGAGKIGLSLHDVNDVPRTMLVADYEWSADMFKQELGRVDRTGQLSPPRLILLATNLAAERKFAATIAARMASLGATSKGAAEATGTDALDQFDVTGDLALNAMRNAVEALPRELKAFFTGSGFVERQQNWGGEGPGDKYVWTPKRRPDQVNMQQFLLEMLMFPTNEANQVYDLFVRHRDALMTEEAAEIASAVRTGRARGQVIRVTQLSQNPPLTLYEIKNQLGEKKGIVQGFVTNYIGDIQTARGLSSSGDPKTRRYTQFTEEGSEALVSGLELNSAETGRVKRLFGVEGHKHIGPEEAWDDLMADDKVKVHGSKNREWILHHRKDGRIQIMGATVSRDRGAVQGLVKYSAVGNYLYVEEDFDALKAFLDRFPPVQPKRKMTDKESGMEGSLDRPYAEEWSRFGSTEDWDARLASATVVSSERNTFTVVDYEGEWLIDYRFDSEEEATRIAKRLRAGEFTDEIHAELAKRIPKGQTKGKGIEMLSERPAKDVTELREIPFDRVQTPREDVLVPGVEYGPALFDMARRLEATARYKALKRAFGKFTTKPPEGDRVELNDVEDIPTVAHENGHLLDWRLQGDKYPSSIMARFEGHVPDGITERALREELAQASQAMRPISGGPSSFDATRRRHTELMADYIGLYLLDPETATRLAPNVTEAFNGLLATKPELQTLVGETIDEGRKAAPLDMMEEIEVIPSPESLIPPDMTGTAAELAERIVTNVSRATKLMKYESGRNAQRWRDLLTPKGKARKAVASITDAVDKQLEDIGAVVEGIRNLRTGETAAEIEARMTPVQKKVLREYRYAQERQRQGLNKFLSDIHGDDFIAYTEDYLMHLYVSKGKQAKKIKQFATRWSKNIPSAKKRRFPTLKEAVDAGLTPLTQNVAILHTKHGEMNWQGALNQRLIFELKGLATEEGLPVILKPKDAPADWVYVDHPAVRQVYARRTKSGDLLLWEGGAKIEPDVWRSVRMVLERPFTGWGVQKWERFNSLAKQSALSFSFFHHFALTESAQGALARLWNPVRGLIMVEKSQTGIPLGFGVKITQPHREGLSLMENPDFVRDLVMHGVNVDPIPDVMVGQLNKMLREWEARAQKFPGLRMAPKAMRRFKEGWDHVLWNRYYTGLKAMAYYDLVKESLARARVRVSGKGEVWRELTPDEVRQTKEKVAELVNDMFGGQDWESKFWLPPKARQALHWSFLAPDWTLSNINVAAKSFTQVKDPTSRKILHRYWRNMVASFFVFGGLFNYLLTKKWQWENEPEHKMDIDVTPIMRALGEALPWVEPDEERRYYIRPGKQFREVMRYLTSPVDIVGAKLSPGIQIILEQATAHQAGQIGWPMPWAREEMEWYESLGARVASAMEKFVPFAVRGNNFGFTFPMSKGMSWYKAQKGYEEIIRMTVDPTIRQKMSKKARELAYGSGALDRMKAEIDAAAELNGLDPTEQFKQARSKVRSEYYARFWREMEDEEYDKAEETAQILIQLGVERRGLTQSGRARGVDESTTNQGARFLPEQGPTRPQLPSPPKPPQPPRRR